MYPKWQIFSPFFVPKFSPFQISFLSPFPIPFLSPVSDTFFIPVSDTLLSPVFETHFCPRFRYPFYPRFRYPFYPRFRYPFLFPPFPAISTPAPDAAMRSCTVPCPQRQNRTQQRTIRMYSSPLVSGHKSSSRSWTRGPLFAL